MRTAASQVRAALCAVVGLLWACDEPASTRACTDDTACGVGLCLDGTCQRTPCTRRGECPRGACGLDGLCQQNECRADAPCAQGFVCLDGLCRSPAAGTGADIAEWAGDEGRLRPPPGFTLDFEMPSAPADAAPQGDARTVTDAGPPSPSDLGPAFFGPLQGRWSLEFVLDRSDCEGARVSRPTVLEMMQSGATVRGWLGPDDPSGGHAIEGTRDANTFELTSVAPIRSTVVCTLEVVVRITGTVTPDGLLSGEADWHVTTVGECVAPQDCHRVEVFSGTR